MGPLNRTNYKTEAYPERILQFGGGNFLRGFTNWMVQVMNEEVGFQSGVVVVKPTPGGDYQELKAQQGLYTVFLNGIKKGKVISEHKVIDCIQRAVNPYTEFQDYMAIAENPDLRFIFSNTTESGIVFDANAKPEDTPQFSFPGKITALLYKRFQHFNGASDKGLIVIPCELTERNGDNLKKVVLQHAQDWGLEAEFKEWVKEDTIFCNTLVDRIVPGYPKDKMTEISKELGYVDDLVVEGEQFHLLVIEGPKTVQEEFPSQACGLNVIFTDDMEPYRTRKVRILNGAHTTLVPVGYLYGIDRVREVVEDPVVGSFLEKAIFDEICPTLDLPEAELKEFANDVLDRFRNPYLEHALMSISLNSISKYKTRVLPSLLAYIERKKALPKRLVFSLAALIAFYRGQRNGEPILLKDNAKILDFFANQWASHTPESVVENVLAHTEFWGSDLTQIEGLRNEVSLYLKNILEQGMPKALAQVML